MNRVFVLENDSSQVEPVLNDLEAHLKEEGFGSEIVHDLRLISEELLLNTVCYGYDDGVKDQLSVRVIREKGELVLEFRDQACAFNPLDAEDRDPECERLGGWGVPLLKELTDDIQYRREGKQNVLIVRKSA